MKEPITLLQYVGKYAGDKNWTPEVQRNATFLLKKVNELLVYLSENGVAIPLNPKTKTHISGTNDGGFRGSTSQTGAPLSAHRQGRAIDIYDPKEAIDDYLTKHPELLVMYGLYREHPSKTSVWCHLTDRAPKSGLRTFYP